MMQLLNRLPGSLSARLALGFLCATLIPGVLLLIATFSWMSRSTVQSYENYLVETALRRQAVISNEFDTAVSSLESFIGRPVTYQLFYNALAFRSTTSAASATGWLTSLLNTPGQAVFQSAWLLNPAGTAIAAAAQENKILPFNSSDRSTSISFTEAEQMTENGALYKVVVEKTADPTQVSIQLITVIRDTGRRPVGYLVAEMNPETLFYQHFEGTNDGVAAEGYIVPPGASTVLTSKDNRVSPAEILASPPVLRVLKGDAPRLEHYEVREDGQNTAVMGYAERIDLLGTPFVLLTEIHMEQVLQAINSYTQAAGFALVLGGFVLALVLVGLFTYMISTPLQEMTGALRAMGRGIVDVPVPSTSRNDEFGDIARLFMDVRRQNAQTTQSLSQRLQDRERDTRVTQSLIQALAGKRDLQSLMNQVVKLIVDNFPMIYHAQIFLTDTEDYAVLRASTGDVGEQLMSRGHRLAVGSISVIGQAVQQRQVIIARDTSASELHRRNEFLPDTRAELAVPLIVNQDVIGALDLQSKERDVFTEDMIGVMQALAAQISIALENVRLFEEAQRRQSQAHLERRVDVRREWTSYLQNYRRQRLTEHAGNTTDYDFTALRAAAVQKGGSVVGEATARGTVPFAVLIQLRGQTLGVLEFELPQVDFHYDKVLLAEELSNRLAVSLDNARLFQESHKAAERERTVNTISAQLTSKRDVNEILQMAIQEVGIALRSSQVSIQLHRSTSTDDPAVSPAGGVPQALPNGNGHSHDD